MSNYFKKRKKKAIASYGIIELSCQMKTNDNILILEIQHKPPIMQTWNFQSMWYCSLHLGGGDQESSGGTKAGDWVALDTNAHFFIIITKSKSLKL